jgi:outer membrane protein assembly factor BamB
MPKHREYILAWLRDISVFALILFFMGAAFFGFLLPWLQSPSMRSGALSRYLPRADGLSALSYQVDAKGAGTRLQSLNMHQLTSGVAFTGGLRSAQTSALRKFLGHTGDQNVSEQALVNRLSAYQVYLVNLRETSKGTETRSSGVIVRGRDGDHELAIYNEALNNDIIFDPPLLLLPANLTTGNHWQSKGAIPPNLQYSSTGEVLSAGATHTAQGDFSDCVETRLRIELITNGKTFNVSTYTDWLCAGVGLVQEEADEGSGPSEWTLIASSARPGRKMVGIGLEDISSTAAPPAALNPAAAAENPTGWTLNRVARLKNIRDNAESIIRPLWVPGSPPMVLGTSYDGDLLALNAAEPTGAVLWRFHPSGEMYGQPAYDPARGNIYFGDSQKELVALDEHGFFQWVFHTGDNVASSPVVFNNLVIFGSEDRTIYALDALTGALKWKKSTSGAVVSSPALAGDLVVIGSDDGTVYALSAADGKPAWTFSTGDAVEAPMVASDGVVYVASRDANLYAVDGKTGTQIWSAATGSALRTAPVLSADAVFVVNTDGAVLAFDRANGRRLWISLEKRYTGPLALAGETLLAADSWHEIHLFRLDGQPAGPAVTSAPAPETPMMAGYQLGITPGGGAAWLADDKGLLWRFGPPLTGEQAVQLAWSYTVADIGSKPLVSRLQAAPALWKGQAIVSDEEGNIFQVDPASGRVKSLGLAPGKHAGIRMPLVVSGDTLLLSAGSSLQAFHLPDLKQLWNLNSKGIGYFEPAVSDGVAAWVTTEKPAEKDTAVIRLYVVDLATGKLRWGHALAGAMAGGNVILREGVLYSGSPAAAFQLKDGKPLWQAKDAGAGLGGGALSTDGAILFASSASPKDSSGTITAYRTADGSVLWARPLAWQGPGFLDRLWVEALRPGVGGNGEGMDLVVPLADAHGDILGLDPQTGKDRWHYHSDVPRFGMAFVNQGLIWQAQLDGQVLALGAGGKVLARYCDTQAGLDGYVLAEHPIVAGQYVVMPMGWSLVGLRVPGTLVTKP